MSGRASIVGAAETSVGKVREHNEDAHHIDPELGIFLVCDGMGGHAAGEVASALAIKVIREEWSSGAMQSARGSLSDEGSLGGGVGARLRLLQFDPDGHFSLWGRAGLGYLFATTPDAAHGPGGFAGALFLLQPAVRRFALGVEVDATGMNGAFGFAVLPTLRCAL